MKSRIKKGGENLKSTIYKQAEKERVSLVSMTAHQLRTPLISMKWICEMLLKGDGGKLSSQQEELIKELSASVQHMNDLVSHLLSVARIESGQLLLELKPVNLNDFYNKLIVELQPSISRKSHSVSFKISGDVPQVKTDLIILSEILKNLLSNSIKYTPDKGRIEVFVSLKGKEILFSVKDNGLGIPKDQQLKVFQKFFRGSNAVRLTNDGTGLGLYIVKNLIQLLGGKIWFESKENKGTTFYFTLPIRR